MSGCSHCPERTWLLAEVSQRRLSCFPTSQRARIANSAGAVLARSTPRRRRRVSRDPESHRGSVCREATRRRTPSPRSVGPRREHRGPCALWRRQPRRSDRTHGPPHHRKGGGGMPLRHAEVDLVADEGAQLGNGLCRCLGGRSRQHSANRVSAAGTRRDRRRTSKRTAGSAERSSADKRSALSKWRHGFSSHWGCSAALVVMAGQRRCSEGCESEADFLACASMARKVRPERHWFARARYPYGSVGTASQHSCTRTFATIMMTCPVGSRVFRSAGCTV